MDNFIPDMYQKSIYAIDYDKLKEDGIKCILFDLDNTCVPYVDTLPNKRLKSLFEHLKDLDFKIIIFTNSPKKRVEPFKKELEVDCSAMSLKPLKRKFLYIMKTFNFDLSEVVIIGDQIMTDVLGGNRVGIKTILVNPMSNVDRFGTKILRIFEKDKLRKMHKRGILTIGKYYD